MYQAAVGHRGQRATCSGGRAIRSRSFRSGTTAALGADSALTVLVTPEIDTFRYDNLWNTDLRVGEDVPGRARSNIRVIVDVFNVFNANTALVREQQRARRPASTRSRRT